MNLQQLIEEYMQDMQPKSQQFQGYGNTAFQMPVPYRSGYQPQPAGMFDDFSVDNLWSNLSAPSMFEMMAKPLVSAANYMRPSNYGERMHDVFGWGEYLSDEERANLPLDDPRRDAAQPLIVGAADVGAGAALKYGPRVGKQALGVAPDMINKLEQRLGLPETPFQKNIVMGEKGYGRMGGDPEMLQLAKDMDDLGKSRENIYNATGWWKGLDDKWRYEYEDTLSLVDRERDIFDPMKANVNYPELYRGYPESPEFQMQFSPETANSSYMNRVYGGGREEHVFDIGAKYPERVPPNIGHEMQHYAQGQEGHTGGASPNQFRQRVYKTQNEGWKQVNDVNLDIAAHERAVVKLKAEGQQPEKVAELEKNLDRLYDAKDDLVKRYGLNLSTDEIAMNLYRRTYGEAEARMTQKSVGMSMDERRMGYPWQRFDVPEERLFIDQSSGDVSLMRDIQKLENDDVMMQVGDRDVRFTKRKRAANEETVLLDMAAVDESWAKDPSFYLSKEGSNRIGNRYENLQEAFKTSDTMEMPEVGLTDKGSIAFTDGRHRAAVLRDMGVDTLPVTMTPEDAARARELGFVKNQAQIEEGIWYHGTNKDFEKFIDPEGIAGHFTKDMETAAGYGDRLVTTRLNVKNPKTIMDEDWRMLRDKPGMIRDLKKEGFDAVISDDTGDIIPFYPDDVEIIERKMLTDYPDLNAKIMAEREAFKSKARGQGSSANVGKSKSRVGTTGQYVGAPAGVNTPQALGKIRKDYMQAARLGAAGRDWYGDSSLWIGQVTPDTIRGKQMADVLGVTSQGTGVDTNLGFTIKGTVQNTAGVPVNTGRFPGQQSPLIEEILAGHNPDLGPKRTPFAENLTVSWNPFLQERPVHDIWQGRAMGYTNKAGKPWDTGFSQQQHAFMDEQMDWINKRLNQIGAEGYADWNNLNTQAAAWTGAKIKAGDLLPEEAAMHFGSFSPKYQANATHEAVTGIGTGHLENMPLELKVNYSQNNKWVDTKGRDMLYSDMGLMVEPTDAAMGAYKPEGGLFEFNPAQVGHPLVNMEEVEKGIKMVSPEARAILDAVEGTRAYVDVQNAGAWHKLIAGNKAQSNSSLHIPLERPVDIEDMRALAQLAEDNGMFAVDTGRGINLINDPWTAIGKERTGPSLLKELKKGLRDDLQRIIPEASDAYRVTADTGYINYQQAWAAGEGSGEATRVLQNLFADKPEILNKLDQSPALRQKVLKKLDMDAKLAKANNLPIREDVQTARRIIAESGLKGLFRALEQGAVLPAVALGIVPLLMEEGEDGSM